MEPFPMVMESVPPESACPECIIPTCATPAAWCMSVPPTCAELVPTGAPPRIEVWSPVEIEPIMRSP